MKPVVGTFLSLDRAGPFDGILKFPDMSQEDAPPTKENISWNTSECQTNNELLEFQQRL